MILWDPAERVERVSDAALPDMTPVPILEEPSRKVTEPLVPDGTVAVKVTDCV